MRSDARVLRRRRARRRSCRETSVCKKAKNEAVDTVPTSGAATPVRNDSGDALPSCPINSIQCDGSISVRNAQCLTTVLHVAVAFSVRAALTVPARAVRHTARDLEVDQALIQAVASHQFTLHLFNFFPGGSEEDVGLKPMIWDPQNPENHLFYTLP